MSKVLCVVTLSLFLAGCAVQPSQSPEHNLRLASIKVVDGFSESTNAYLKSKTEVEAIESAQESVRRSLKDPGSAQFRNVRLVSWYSGKVVCGEVNGKNSYGGYVGFKRFVASPNSSEIERTGNRFPEIDTIANSGITVACGLR